MKIPSPARLVITTKHLYPDDGAQPLPDGQDSPFVITETINAWASTAALIPTEGDAAAVIWDNDRHLELVNLVDHGDYVSGQTMHVEPGEYPTVYEFHRLDPYDAVTLAPAAGVPQPLEVVTAAIRLEAHTMLAQQLDAAVGPDNQVVTLVLETGLGTYVRFGNAWQQLRGDSDTLDDLTMVQVGPSALDIFDAADGAGTVVDVFELPLPSDDDPSEWVDPEELPAVVAAVAASGVTASVPVVRVAADLPMALRFADTYPAARWYVAKRAVALNAAGAIPADWNVITSRPPRLGGLTLGTPDAVRSAAHLCAGLTAAADPDGETYRAVLAGARQFGLLSDPDVVAMINTRAGQVA